MREFSHQKRLRTRSVEETLAVADSLATMLPAPRVVVLRGELGAGKTTLVKGWVAALGAGSRDEVTSPTFTLVHEYASATVKVYHLDLYRLETERELATLGLDEMAAEPDALVLIEWGEKFESVMKRADAEVQMLAMDEDERWLVVRWRE
jgi:tRNA threonylcarbamoyladenosine biosynthesis protein TsaE